MLIAVSFQGGYVTYPVGASLPIVALDPAQERVYWVTAEELAFTYCNLDSGTPS